MTDETPNPSVPQREQAVASFLAEARKSGRLSSYRVLLRNLPILLRQHGLGQTLAYLQARAGGRAESPYQVLYQSLSNRLRETMGLPPNDILTTLTAGESPLYLLAFEEVSAFVLAIRQAMVL